MRLIRHLESLQPGSLHVHNAPAREVRASVAQHALYPRRDCSDATRRGRRGYFARRARSDATRRGRRGYFARRACSDVGCYEYTALPRGTLLIFR